MIRDGRRCGGDIRDGRRACGLDVDDGDDDGPPPLPATVEFTLPPANYAADESTSRNMGRIGGHLALHHVLLGTSHYVWWRQGPASPDPGADLGSGSALVPALAGRTGIMVPLPALPQTDAENATATAAAINAVDGLTASSVGAVVEVTGFGMSSVAPGAVSFAARGREGIIGTPDTRAFTRFSTPASSMRGHLLDASRWGNVPIVMTGAALGIGATHAQPVVVSVYQGGISDTDFNGATRLGALVITAGDGVTGGPVYIPNSGVYVDPSLGRVWLMTMHAPGSELSYTWSGQPSATGHDYIVTAGNAVFVEAAGVASSDPADLPATLGATNPALNNIGFLAIQIAFVDAALFQCSVAPGFDFGTQAGRATGVRDASFTFTSSTTVGFLTGNPYTVPATMRGLELYQLHVNYAAHALGVDLGAHLGIGGAAVNDWSGATVYHVGPATGATGIETGWVSTAVAPAGIPLTEGSRVWPLIESPEDVGTANAFDTGAPNEFEAEHWGLASWYGGAANESGYEPDSSPSTGPGEGSTNLSFDASLYGVQDEHDATTNPGPWVVVPNGALVSDGNNAGIYGTAITRGFAVITAGE